MLVGLFEGVFVGPVSLTGLILALHPVAVLLVLSRQVLFQLGLVTSPVSFELRLGPLHVPIDRLRFDPPNRLSLHEISFLVASGPCHCASQPGSSDPLASLPHDGQFLVESARLVGYMPSH